MAVRLSPVGEDANRSGSILLEKKNRPEDRPI